MVVELAEERGKVAVLSETGQERIPEANWWTQRLLNPIKSDPVATKIAWVLVWRNARQDHHYAPYPGHSSVENFIEFCNDPVMLFQGQTPDLYKLD